MVLNTLLNFGKQHSLPISLYIVDVEESQRKEEKKEKKKLKSQKKSKARSERFMTMKGSRVKGWDF